MTEAQLKLAVLKSVEAGCNISAVRLGACERFIRQRVYPGKTVCLEVSMMILMLVEDGLIRQSNEKSGIVSDLMEFEIARYRVTDKGIEFLAWRMK